MKKLVIAGTGSGVGKTSVTLGLVAGLKRRGLKVATFKVGPDYLDPSWLKMASGRTCYNLDGWMTSRQYVQQLFESRTKGCDIAIIEGVMGMFDGASPTSLTGSTAEIASWLNAPVLLVCNSHGSARSFAATVKGFNEFEDGINVTGVIANHCGSKGHIMIMEQALEAAGQPPLAGSVQRNTLPTLPGRHLGLHTAEQQSNAKEIISELADKVSQSIDLDKILDIAEGADASEVLATSPVKRPKEKVRLAIARDAAFQFYYPDNLEAFAEEGIELVEFSPLNDAVLPENIDGLYIGGGYPEVYAAQLSHNESMLNAIRNHAQQDKFLYAECGGLMYLSRFVRDTSGTEFPMLAILPFATEMLEKRKMLGYMTTTLKSDSILGPEGMELRGHEFHYSQIIDEDEQHSFEKVYSVKGRRRTSKERAEGFSKGRILASYVHQHFASNAQCIKELYKGISETLSD
ncbi:MAG: cobyrinate a,c-diamide synthase [Lentisphaeraceae bacterium]|nr:cobyrinate a,c-diamide synthase [Lentisphaeraceae bacterium]